MNLILHIGTHKTGSTSIQNFFYINRDLFMKEGLFYPKYKGSGTGHKNIAWLARKGHAERLSDELLLLIQSARDNGCENVLISAEGLEFVRNKMILSLFQVFDSVCVVVFIRSQDELLESEYNQHVKDYNHRFDNDIFHFYMYHDWDVRFDYFKLLDTYSDVFGQSNVCAYNYNKSLSSSIYELVYNKVLGSKSISPRFPDQGDKNVSISNMATIYISRVNKNLNLKLTQHNVAIDVASKYFESNDAVFLDQSYRRRLMKKYETLNHCVADRFGLEPIFNFNVNSKKKYVDYNADFDESIYNDILMKTGID